MILEIARMGHPILEKRAAEVEDVSAPHVQKFIADLVETFQALGGVGLAAPQVKELLRILVLELTPELASTRNFEPIPLTVLINPIIEPLTDEMETRWEACFSLPGLMGEVERHRSIRYTALTPAGEKITHEVHDYHARIIQHEYDHLDGILYPQRMRNMKKFGFIEEVKQSMMQA
jgi:peptide deformylase